MDDRGGIPSGVVLRDVQMPFLRMVWVLLKLALASIPALILASAVLTLTAVLLGTFVGSTLLGLAGERPSSTFEVMLPQEHTAPVWDP